MPRKAIYLRFEHDHTLEFEFFLALQLHVTVDELRRTMSNREFVEWAIYFARKAQRQQLQGR